MTTAEHEAARLLLDARRRRAALPVLPEGMLPKDLATGYRIQDAFVDLSGDLVAGYKLGATSAKAQSFLHIDQPFYGRVLACDLHDSPASLMSGRFIFTLIEAEFAFRTAKDIAPRDEPYSENDMAEAVASLHPAFEVVSSGLESWYGQGAPSLIADNGVNGALVLGAGTADWRALDLGRHEVTFEVNGEPYSHGVGANALGHPLRALAWLANELANHDRGLPAGSIVSTGVVTDFLELHAGDKAVADFGVLGQVEVSFR